MAIMGAVRAATRCEVCGAIGALDIFHIGKPVRAAVSCEVTGCSGRMWTIGRYGSTQVEGRLQTVLQQASPEELALLGALAGRMQNATVVEVVAALEEIDTPTSRALSEWVEANGGLFAAAGALVALITLLSQLMSAPTPVQHIEIEKIIIRDDGQVEIPPSTE